MTGRRRRVVGAVALLLALVALAWGDDLRHRYRVFALDRHERRWEARAPDSYDDEDELLAEARDLLDGGDGGGVIEYDDRYGFVRRLSYGHDARSPDSGRSYEVVAFRPRGAGG